MLTDTHSFLDECRSKLLTLEREIAELVQRKKRREDLYELAASDEDLSEQREKLLSLDAQIKSKRKLKKDVETDVTLQERTPQKHKEILTTLEMLQAIVTEANETEPYGMSRDVRPG